MSWNSQASPKNLTRSRSIFATSLLILDISILLISADCETRTSRKDVKTSAHLQNLGRSAGALRLRSPPGIDNLLFFLQFRFLAAGTLNGYMLFREIDLQTSLAGKSWTSGQFQLYCLIAHHKFQIHSSMTCIVRNQDLFTP